MVLKIVPDSISFKDSSLVTGFHGIGATGYWTVKYLIQKMNAERIAFVDSSVIAPITSNEGGRLVTPYELFQKDNLIFFNVEAPPYRNEDIYFFKEFSEFVISAGFKEAALIGGLDSRLKVDKTSYRLVKTSSYTPEGKLKEAKLLEDGHMIVGPVAILLNQFEALGFPAFSILPYASAERVDPRAAYAAINVLSDLYGFKVELEPLIKGADVLDSEISRHEERLRRQGENIYT
jgi:uncharacterized protein